MRALVRMAAVGLVLALSACGGGGGDTPGASNAGGGQDSGNDGVGGKLVVTFDITGEDTVKGSTTQSIPGPNMMNNTCADYVMGITTDGRTIYPLPSLLDVQSGKVAGKGLAVDAHLKDYHGPGTYAMDSLEGTGDDPGILIDYRPYNILDDGGTTTQVVVEASGAGRWTFTGLRHDDGTGHPSPGINGSVSWTCQG
jgi:hypothetical protein